MADGRPTVLVVEDEPDLAEMYGLHLSGPYDVRTAHSGSEALEKLDESVAVVLLDRKMPGLSGDDVLRKLGERDLDCRVAMVTAVTPTTDLVDMAVEDYLVKPVGGDELRRTVAQLVAIATHGDLVREFVELSMKQAALETTGEPSSLDADPEYERLNDRLADLSTELGDLSEALSVSEFELFIEGLVRRLGGEPSGGRP